MSKPMTVGDLHSFLLYVNDFHNPMRGAARADWKTVKYVDPHFDNRTGVVFSVTLRGFSYEDKCFHICNEFRDVPESLYDRMIAWLREPN